VSINEELIEAKKNLPKALVFGTLVVFIVYVLYFVGMNSVLSAEVIMANGDGAVTSAASKLFSPFIGSLIGVFVVISCLGTTNGLVLASTRTPYSLALRNHGPFPKVLAKVNDKTGMPVNSALFAFGLTLLYLGVWYSNFAGFFGQLFIDISELPIVLIYVLYTTLYISAMIKIKDLSKFKRFVLPSLAIAGSLVVVYGGLINPNISYYMMISFVIILIGLFFYRNNTKSV
jgi:APA family basic amino acid/polyamine antiporter